MGDRSTDRGRHGAGSGAARHEIEPKLNVDDEDERGQDQDWR